MFPTHLDPRGLPMLIAALLIVVAMCALTAGVIGSALFLVGYGAGWAHNAIRSP